MNEVLMENEVRVSEFTGMMVKHEFELEHSLRESWIEKRSFWRTAKENVLLDRFREYMESKQVTEPESVQTILQRFYDEQQTLNNSRKELMNSFKLVLRLCDWFIVKTVMAIQGHFRAAQVA